MSKMSIYFPEVKKTISFEGAESSNPLAYRFYDANKKIGSKTMAEHLRFAVAYWHTMKSNGADIFGSGTFNRKWNEGKNSLEIAEKTMAANFEFCTKLGVPFWCFHDRDIAPEGENFSQSCKNLEKIVGIAKNLQKQTGLKLLWGTANLFSHPRYAHGAATNPDVNVVAYAGAQVRRAMEATLELGGQNYVFWGGREGYDTLLNTNYQHEQEQLARFFQMAVAYKKKIGFKGQFLIEPKPKEPTKHQYDFDSATVIAFLKTWGLEKDFKLNIENNHATLAGHTFEHELTVASSAGMLGSVDANTGDLLIGWDTDQFPSNIYSAVFAMMVILKQGGLGSGGLNFDAKVRRGSIDTIDLFYAHIGAIDVFAKALLIADKIINEGKLDKIVEARYQSFNTALGKDIIKGKASLKDCEEWVLKNGEPTPVSGRQELLENIINQYIFK